MLARSAAWLNRGFILAGQPVCDPSRRDPAARTKELAPGADAALELPAAALHAGGAGKVRRQLQRQIPHLRAADGDDLRPGRDQGALHGALARPAAGARHHPHPDRRPALAAGHQGRRPPRPPQADAAALPRRADALLPAAGRGDRRPRDRLLAARRGVRDPPADAGDHARGDPQGRLRRRRRPPLRAPAHRPHPGAGGDRLARRPAERPGLAPLRRPRALGPSSKSS